MRLETFATHVQQICLAPVGDKFTLYAGYEVRAEIEIAAEDSVLVNNRWEGNRQGAVQAYTKMVNRFTGVYEHPVKETV